MKKFFRKLFSPLAFNAFLLVLEVLLLAAIIGLAMFLIEQFLEFKSYWIYLIYRLAITLFELIIFFTIVNKRENPEYKIPWISMLVFAPTITLILYISFGNHALRRGDNKIYKETNRILKEKFTVDKTEKDEFRKEVPLNYRGVFKYLRHSTHFHNENKNRITYYKNGETFFPEFVESLKKAEKFIFIEFFIIGEGKWWSQVEEILKEKVKNGVEVRLVYDELGSFGVLPNCYDRKLRKAGINCYRFHKLRPVLSSTYNNRDHRKIVVIDHKIAFTGGMNLADEYANDEVRFGYWKDTMVKIEGRGIKNLIAIFLQNYDLCQRKVSDYDRYIDGDYPEFDEKGYIYAFGDSPGRYSNNEPIGEQNYIEILNQANRTAWISTPYFIPPFRLTEALKSAAKRGVDVKLFLPGIPDKKLPYWLAKCEFKDLIEAGVKVYLYTPGFNHEKQIVVDDILAFCGTINYDFRSLTHHFECGVTLFDTPCIADMVDDFKEMESQSEPVTKYYKVNFFQRIFVAIVKLFRTMF